MNKYIPKKEPQTKEDFCNAYADKALKQYAQAVQLHLPDMNPLLWNNNKDLHLKWCMAVPKNTASQENNKRQNIIDDYISSSQGKTDLDPNFISGIVLGKMIEYPDESKSIKKDKIILIPEMVLGLRTRYDPEIDSSDPIIEYLTKKGINPAIRHTRNETDYASFTFHYRSRGWYWISINKGNYENAVQYNLPPGIVICLRHTIDHEPVGIFGIYSNYKNSRESIGNGNFHKKCGGDFEAPSGEGLCWYESTGLGFTDWTQIKNLPRGTVIGLKHSINQPKKKLIWKDDVYDPVDPKIQPPPGFKRRIGGDLGAPIGEGYFWYEKVTGN